jgi:hypothetical protein
VCKLSGCTRIAHGLRACYREPAYSCSALPSGRRIHRRRGAYLFRCTPNLLPTASVQAPRSAMAATNFTYPARGEKRKNSKEDTWHNFGGSISRGRGTRASIDQVTPLPRSGHARGSSAGWTSAGRDERPSIRRYDYRPRASCPLCGRRARRSGPVESVCLV